MKEESRTRRSYPVFFIRHPSSIRFDLGCQDSNLEPSDPESDVLPIAPQPNKRLEHSEIGVFRAATPDSTASRRGCLSSSSGHEYLLIPLVCHALVLPSVLRPPEQLIALASSVPVARADSDSLVRIGGSLAISVHWSSSFASV